MPKIFTVCGRRWETQEVMDDYFSSFSWCDGNVVVDDRDRDPADPWVDERWLYAEQRRLAMEGGADWVLAVDPDERFEINAQDVIRSLTEKNRNVVYRFPIRELWEPLRYRIDGIWGKKIQARLYKIGPDQRMGYKRLHNNPCPIFPRVPRMFVDINLYHQKHIEPENRISRMRQFMLADPKAIFSSVLDYKYLADERGKLLEEIPEGREYFPPYRRNVWQPQ